MLNCEWTTDRFNNTNSALYFKKGYAQAPPGVYFDPANGGFTVMTWIKLISINKYQRIIDFGNGGPSDNCLIYLTNTTTNLGFDLYNNTIKVVRSFNGNLTLSIWTHLAVSVTGSSGSFYIDGVLDRSATGKIKDNKSFRK